MNSIVRLTAAWLALAASAALAQGFPSRAVTLIVPFPAGGPTDVAGRALAEATSRHLGQPVVVENRPGAGGTLGPAALVAARPDGHVVTMVPSTAFRLPHMENTGFDPLKDIRYVIGVSGYVFAVIVRADQPWKTFHELIAHVKANPDKVTYGSHGIGSTVHLAMEEMSMASGLKLTHIPYKGSADMLAAVLGGHIDIALDSTGAVPQVAAGKLRVLAVFTENRAAVWPDAPTLKELGYGVVSTSPYGIGAPAGTPPEAVRVLHDAFKKGLEDPIHLKTLEKYNLILFPFDKFVAGPMNERILREYVFPRVKATSDIKVEGKTDVVGMYEHNARLSQNRSRTVESDIRESTKGNFGSLTSRGTGEDEPLFTNDLPEGRFFNRTVQVIIETPLKDVEVE
jgi:tripartite-type tricarboxylate transporter receptor subunit TctC